MGMVRIEVTAIIRDADCIYVCVDVSHAKKLAQKKAPMGKKIIWHKVVGSWNNWVGTIDNMVFCLINTELQVLDFFFIIGLGFRDIDDAE